MLVKNNHKFILIIILSASVTSCKWPWQGDDEQAATTVSSTSASPSPTPSCTASSTWSTIQDFQLAAGQHSIGNALSIDSSGNILAAGNAYDSSAKSHWTIFRSTNSGNTWTNVEDFQSPANGSTSSLQLGSVLAQIGSGIFYSLFTDGSAHWRVRTSSDGLTWNSIDDYTYTIAGYPAAVASVGGTMYVAGHTVDFPATNEHLIVRKSTNAGSSWSTILDYQLQSGQSSGANGIVLDANGIIYVAGYGDDSTPDSHWLVRKSTDAGTNWSTVDNYQFNPGLNAQATSIAIAPSGTLYVAGWASSNGSGPFLTIRKSTDGSSWSIVDEYQSGDGSISMSYPKHLAIDTSGNIYVAGYMVDSTGVQHWIIRKGTENGSSWSTIDDFQYVSGKNSQAHGFLKDGSNNLYSIGIGNDSSNKQHWIVRKLSACQ